MKKTSCLTFFFLAVTLVLICVVMPSKKVSSIALMEPELISRVWQMAEEAKSEKRAILQFALIGNFINDGRSPQEEKANDKQSTQVYANFTYPTTEEVARITGRSKITLNKGSTILRNSSGDIIFLMGLSYIFRGNVTGSDSILDDVVVLTYSTGGSGISECVYVYTTSERSSKLLWSFNTGDRADGGLRDIYSENDNLVVETFNPEGLGACCTKSFTKSIYKWTSEKFQLFKSTKLKNPSGTASPIYDSKSKK